MLDRKVFAALWRSSVSMLVTIAVGATFATAAIAQSVLPSALASGSAQTPSWKMEYFDGEGRCDALAKVRDASNAEQWKTLNAAQPVERPVRLWMRLSSETRIVLERGWVAAIDRDRKSVV